jgi:CheY-like chemotaxis protein
VAAAPAAVASEMAGYLNRRAMRSTKQEAVTGDGDLVTDVVSGRQALDKIKEDELPDAMRKLSAAERKTLVDKQMQQRNALNDRLAELIKKRDQYASEQQQKTPAKKGDSFDRAVENTLKAQIRR